MNNPARDLLERAAHLHGVYRAAMKDTTLDVYWNDLSDVERDAWIAVARS
jgi:hypothetical protein